MVQSKAPHSQAVPVDGHAHFHAHFSLETWLANAKVNFSKTVTKQGANKEDANKEGVILLAHIGIGDPFQLIRSQIRDLQSGWQLELDDNTSLVFTSRNFSVAVVAGRQIVTKEGLELLSLCSNQEIPSGLAIHDAIELANQQGAIPVVPWGFGKWWFRRGRVMEELVRSKLKSPWMIGDSGCRLSQLEPQLLDVAQQHGIVCLAGSDPLPLDSHVARVGSFGSMIPGSLDFEAPTDWIRSTLRHLATDESKPDLKTFGGCRSATQFLNDQIRLRIARK